MWRVARVACGVMEVLFRVWCALCVVCSVVCVVCRHNRCGAFSHFPHLVSAPLPRRPSSFWNPPSSPPCERVSNLPTPSTSGAFPPQKAKTYEHPKVPTGIIVQLLCPPSPKKTPFPASASVPQPPPHPARHMHRAQPQAVDNTSPTGCMDPPLASFLVGLDAPAIEHRPAAPASAVVPLCPSSLVRIPADLPAAAWDGQPRPAVCRAVVGSVHCQ